MVAEYQQAAALPENTLQASFDQTLQRILVDTPYPNIAVALSGGADSMALTLLTKDFVSQYGGNVVALTIDHGLRESSASEVITVGNWMQQLSIPHHVLTLDWKEKPTSDIQNRARNMRYALLEQWCARHNISYLLTGHHADDVEETLMMRFWRGASIEGLSGIPETRKTPFVTIIRPLLAFRKQSLEQYLLQRRVDWLEDPSNATDDYERNRMRHLLQEFPLPTNQAKQFASLMATAQKIIDLQINDWLAQHLLIHKDGTSIINLESPLPINIMHTALSRIIMHLNGSDAAPRGHELVNLLHSLSSNLRKRCTLGGLIFEHINASQNSLRYLIYREPERLPECGLESHMIWDKRFSITCKNVRTTNLNLRGLGVDGLEQLKSYTSSFPTHLTHGAKLGLFSIWQLDQLLAVPHIDYWNDDELTESQTLKYCFNIEFSPSQPINQQPKTYPPLST